MTLKSNRQENDSPSFGFRRTVGARQNNVVPAPASVTSPCVASTPYTRPAYCRAQGPYPTHGGSHGTKHASLNVRESTFREGLWAEVASELALCRGRMAGPADRSACTASSRVSLVRAGDADRRRSGPQRRDFRVVAPRKTLRGGTTCRPKPGRRSTLPNKRPQTWPRYVPRVLISRSIRSAGVPRLRGAATTGATRPPWTRPFAMNHPGRRRPAPRPSSDAAQSAQAQN